MPSAPPAGQPATGPPATGQWGPIRRAIAIGAGAITILFWLLVLALLVGLSSLTDLTVQLGLVVFVHGRIAYAREFSRRYGGFWRRRLGPLGRLLRLSAHDLRVSLGQANPFMPASVMAGPNTAGQFATQYAAHSLWRSLVWFAATMTWFPVRDLLRATRP